MKTPRVWLAAGGLVLVAAVVLIVWQHQRLAERGRRVAELEPEAAAVAALREEVAQLKNAAVDREEFERMREAHATAQRELAGLRAQAASGLRAKSEAAELRTELAQKSAEGSSNAIAGPMAEMMKGAMEQQFQARLSRMREKLGLTPDQTEAMRAIMDRQAKAAAEAMQGVFSGKTDAKRLAELSKSNGNPEAEIEALLTPEQKTAYTEFKDEEAVGNARMAANAELLQLQTTLGLNTEEQDKVYAVLYDQTLRQLKGDLGGVQVSSDPAAVMESMLDRKAQALAEVLTPDQITRYREQQQVQIKFLRNLVAPKDAAPGTP